MSPFHTKFSWTSPEIRVRFAPGIRKEIAAEIERLGAGRGIVLTTPGQAERAAELARHAGGRVAGIVPLAQMHSPVAVTERAVAELRRLEGDCLVSLGGGSAIGLAKAVSLRTGLPQIALPTTYAGSEATPILGETDGGRKRTFSEPRIRPRTILYDVELVLSLPAAVTVASAFNAMAHAAEGLYARDRSPLSALLAREGLRAFRDALPATCRDPGDIEARAETLYGAWLCGTVLGQVGMALHHKLCHVLGGSFNLPHAETHAAMLPHTIAFNAAAAGELLDPVRELFGGGHAGEGLARFADATGAPKSLGGLGMREEDLERAADLAMAEPYWNPRPLVRGEILDLLRRAWRGDPPLDAAGRPA